MQQKKLIQSYKDIIYLITLSILSFGLTYHYGFIGLMPMDNTVLFNGGFRVLKGNIPFNDYWLVTGPLLDYINAFFFKIFGISWSTFIIHSALFNTFFAVASFFLLIALGLKNYFSFFYSFLIAILFYPVVGTPFVDHHSTFFLVISFYCLIIAIKTNNNKYFYYIPVILLLSFLSKQTPASYGIIFIFVTTIIYLFVNQKNAKIILLNSITGSLIAFFLILLFFFLTKINFNDFFEQYILFASTIGGERFKEYDLNIFSEIINYKFLFYFIFVLLFTLINFKTKKIEIENFLIVICFIGLSLLMILHQAISLNQNFIFFLIPLLCGVFHSYYQKSANKFLLIFTIGICVFAVTKYHFRFNEERKFNELENINISKAVDAKILDKKLKGLKWITYINPEKPEKELTWLVESINIFKSDQSNKILITEYQVVAPILNIYDNSPNQWHHPSVSFPLKGHKYFDTYKNYFISNIKKKEVKVIYELTKNKELITELILNEKCHSKKKITEMLIKIKLNFNCEDLK